MIGIYHNSDKSYYWKFRSPPSIFISLKIAMNMFLHVYLYVKMISSERFLELEILSQME